MTRPRDASLYPTGTWQNPGLPPGVPCTLAGIAEHMRADALSYMAEGGPSDVIGQWLWNLAARLEQNDALKKARPGPKPKLPAQRTPDHDSSTHTRR